MTRGTARYSVWLLTAAFVAALVWLAIPHSGPDLRAPVAVGLVLWAGALWRVPGIHVELRSPLDAVSWMLSGWAMTMFVVPAVTMQWGPTQGTLALIPSDAHMRAALWWQLVAFAGWTLGVYLHHRAQRPTTGTHGARPARRSASFPEGRALWFSVIALSVVGLLGVWARFGSVSDVLDYYRGRLDLDLMASDGHPVVALAALVLPPALGLAGVLIGVRRNASLTAWALGAVLVVLGTSVYNYNRASVVASLLAYLIASSVGRRPIGVLSYLVVGSLLVPLALAVGQFRTTYFATSGGEISEEAAAVSTLAHQEVLDAYFRAPAYPGAVARDLSSGAYEPRAGYLLNDLVAPIPALGSGFREDTTSVRFSGVVRGTEEFVDTAPPLYVELMMTVGGWFLLPVFVVVGLAASWLRSATRTAGSSLIVFGAALASVWMGYLLVGSAQFFVQAVIQFGTILVMAWAVGHGLYAWTRSPAKPGRRRRTAEGVG